MGLRDEGDISRAYESLENGDENIENCKGDCRYISSVVG